ncbi:hypothetical protein Efla_006146 [Eimeria flavescens]
MAALLPFLSCGPQPPLAPSLPVLQSWSLEPQQQRVPQREKLLVRPPAACGVSGQRGGPSGMTWESEGRRAGAPETADKTQQTPQLLLRRKCLQPSVFASGCCGAPGLLPLWRRVLPLVGGFIVNTVLGCTYSLANVVPYVSSYMRFKGRVDTRHSDLGWVFTAGLASVCFAMAYGNKLHQRVGLAQRAALGCLLMSASFFLAASTCHSLFLFTLACGAGTGLALGLASVCPLTAAYLAWPRHKGLAAAVVLSGLSASPLLFSALELSVVNPERVAFSWTPYKDHPYEKYLSDQPTLRRVPRLFCGLGCCCLLLAPAALLLGVHSAAAAASSNRHRRTSSSHSTSSGSSSSAWEAASFPPLAEAVDEGLSGCLHTSHQIQQQQQQQQQQQMKEQWGSSFFFFAAAESVEGQPRRRCSLLRICVVYVLLGLSVHFISVFYEAVASAAHGGPLPSTRDPEAAALLEARRHQQQQPALLQEDSVGVDASGSLPGFSGGFLTAASLLGRIGWGVMTDVWGGAAAMKGLCFSLIVLLGCCAAALQSSPNLFVAWLSLLYICMGGISVTLPLVVAEAASPADFGCLYTLAYTSKPASAALSSLLLMLMYPSVGLTGCCALAASAACLALLLCCSLPEGSSQDKQAWLLEGGPLLCSNEAGSRRGADGVAG